MVEEPAGPALDGKAVGKGEVVAVEPEGEVEEEGGEKKVEGEGVALEPAAAAEAKGAVAHAGDEAELEEEKELEDAPEFVGEVGFAVNGGEVLGFGEVGWGESVVGEVAVWGSLGEFVGGDLVGEVFGAGFGGVGWRGEQEGDDGESEEAAHGVGLSLGDFGDGCKGCACAAHRSSPFLWKYGSTLERWHILRVRACERRSVRWKRWDTRLPGEDALECTDNWAI